MLPIVHHFGKVILTLNKTRNSSLSSANDLDVNKTISFGLQNNESGALIALFKLFLDLVTFIFVSPESHF